MKGILGKKVGMTQMFATNGELMPVTVIEVLPNVITQLKTDAVDGYNAIQLGVEDKREKVSNKPEMGHVAKANTAPKRFTKEFRVSEDEISNYEIGQTLDVSSFVAGEFVDVQGTSKGKGFQGVIKRHNQATGPMTHGSRYHRRPGSMGAVAPQVFKGKNLPGQTGAKTITTQNLEIVKVDVENNAIIVKGNIPGAKKSFVSISGAIKNKNAVEAVDLVTYTKADEKDAE